MCFSATASFIAAGLTAAVGLYTVSRSSGMRELPLASMPLFFALQQLAEGGLWLTLPISPEAAVSSWLSHLFLVVALIFWPVFAPVAAFAVEPDVLRRRLIGLCLAIGGAVSAYFLWALLTQPHDALIADGHISYRIGETPITVDGAYMVATTLGLLVSSHRPVAALGLIVLAGSIVSYAVYLETFVSVWCFFAAVASVVVAGHFRAVAASRAAAT
jgi:uncharacterized membrane protein